MLKLQSDLQIIAASASMLIAPWWEFHVRTTEFKLWENQSQKSDPQNNEIKSL